MFVIFQSLYKLVSWLCYCACFSLSFAIVVALNVNNPQDMKLSAYQRVAVYIIRVSIDASYICI